MKYRQHNGQKEKGKRTNNDLQNTTKKTKDRVTQTPLTSGVNAGTPDGNSSSCSTSGTRRFTNYMICNCCSCQCPVYMVVRFTSTYVLTVYYL